MARERAVDVSLECGNVDDEDVGGCEEGKTSQYSSVSGQSRHKLTKNQRPSKLVESEESLLDVVLPTRTEQDIVSSCRESTEQSIDTHANENQRVRLSI